MEIVFVDWAPIGQKSEIRGGIQIRRYYAWTTLNKMVDKVVPFRNRNGSINWKAVIKMFKKDSEIWEPRFRKAVEVALSISEENHEGIERI